MNRELGYMLLSTVGVIDRVLNNRPSDMSYYDVMDGKYYSKRIRYSLIDLDELSRLYFIYKGVYMYRLIYKIDRKIDFDIENNCFHIGDNYDLHFNHDWRIWYSGYMSTMNVSDLIKEDTLLLRR